LKKPPPPLTFDIEQSKGNVDWASQIFMNLHRTLKINLGFHRRDFNLLAMCKIHYAFSMVVVGLIVGSQADVIGATSFTGRTLATVTTQCNR